MELDELEEYRERALRSLGVPGVGLIALDVSAADLPTPKERITARRLRALVGKKNYVNDEPCARVELVTTREALEGLAYIILFTVLTGKDCTISLGRDLSGFGSVPAHLRELQHLRVNVFQSSPTEFGGLTLRPERFQHIPEERGRHPLAQPAWSMAPRPHLHVSELDKVLASDGPGDTVHGFGSPWGSATLAGAMLDICRADAEQHEYDFEGPYGIGGVSAGSAELKVWFRGSVGWELYASDDW